jgi:hypothetical protein
MPGSASALQPRANERAATGDVREGLIVGPEKWIRNRSYAPVVTGTTCTCVKR